MVLWLSIDFAVMEAQMFRVKFCVAAVIYLWPFNEDHMKKNVYEYGEVDLKIKLKMSPFIKFGKICQM